MKKLIAILLLVCAAAVAHAQKDNEGFEPVNGSMMAQPGETIPATKLVAAAYGFIFSVVAIWVGSVAARTRRVEDEIDELKRKLKV
jgi:hypothetical protein